MPNENDDSFDELREKAELEKRLNKIESDIEAIKKEIKKINEARL